MIIRMSARALEQLEEVYDFINQRNSTAAVYIHNDLLDSIDLLSGQPYLGHIEPLLADAAISYRSLILTPTYKAVYQIAGEIITIVSIYDCRQNPSKLRQDILKKKK